MKEISRSFTVNLFADSDGIECLCKGGASDMLSSSQRPVQASGTKGKGA